MMKGSIGDITINYAVANSTLRSVALPHMPGTFTNVTILANTTTDPRCTIWSRNNCGTPFGEPTMEFKTIAVECSLFPCALAYTASVVDGAVVETEVKRSFGQGDWLEDHGAWRGALIPGDLNINPDEDCEPKWWPYKGIPPPCSFGIGLGSIMALGNFFWGFWNGTVPGRMYGEAASDNDVLDVLYSRGVTNFTHIDRVLGSVADSMTAAIHLTGRVEDYDAGSGGGQGNVTGQVFLADTCIEVRWAWIALPAAVAFLTLLLILTVVLGGAMRDQPAWKTSALPVLFHGFDTAELASQSQLLTVSEMEREASGLWVRLTDETSGALRLEACSRQSVDNDKNA
ncbi:hypothetical protein K402DRAFT_81545 [Aulographum hederae CBS 113979]|uniref:Uncharacterized protein n=1 Tax=Aulographum hederae CBS 113979 TaxID=1176131 RepID=A0A6G1H0C4_9PEZI|nr:hypothetical protein K402DRAFT_81545 [Aulographum hederae CBS 113979]